MNECWIHGEPFECEFVPGVECKRGENASMYRLGLYTIPLWSFMILSLVALGRVILHVRNQEQRTGRWRFAGEKKRKNRLTKEVTWNALWYLLAFFVTWIPVTTVGLMELNGIMPTPQALMATQATMPLQGLLNCLIYVRPKYIRWVRKHPQFSVWLKYKRVYKFCKSNVFGLLGESTTDAGLDCTTDAAGLDGMAWVPCEQNLGASSSSSSSSSAEEEKEDPNVRILHENSVHDIEQMAWMQHEITRVFAVRSENAARNVSSEHAVEQFRDEECLSTAHITKPLMCYRNTV